MFFSGAGVSTESGLPDFRGEQGLYSKKYGQLPEWEKQGKLRAAITQNTDGLHQAAGSKSVYRCT